MKKPLVIATWELAICLVLFSGASLAYGFITFVGIGLATTSWHTESTDAQPIFTASSIIRGDIWDVLRQSSILAAILLLVGYGLTKRLARLSAPCFSGKQLRILVWTVYALNACLIFGGPSLACLQYWRERAPYFSSDQTTEFVQK